MKEIAAAKAVENAPSLGRPGASKEEIEKGLEEALPAEPAPNRPSVVIPQARRAAVVDMIYRAKTPRQKEAILKNSMEYFPASTGDVYKKIIPRAEEE